MACSHCVQPNPAVPECFSGPSDTLQQPLQALQWLRPPKRPSLSPPNPFQGALKPLLHCQILLSPLTHSPTDPAHLHQTICPCHIISHPKAFFGFPRPPAQLCLPDSHPSRLSSRRAPPTQSPNRIRYLRRLPLILVPRHTLLFASHHFFFLSRRLPFYLHPIVAYRQIVKLSFAYPSLRFTPHSTGCARIALLRLRKPQNQPLHHSRKQDCFAPDYCHRLRRSNISRILISFLACAALRR